MIELPMRFEEAPLLLTVQDVYSEEECRQFVQRIECNAPTLASNNRMYRNQDRVLQDDPATAQDLFFRLKEHLPHRIRSFDLVGLNERLRYYRYQRGQRFSPHKDHWYRPTDRRITLYSVLVYFNGDFEGGETRFSEQVDRVITPEAGSAAIFQHKLEHEGCEVRRGVKYAMRTDVLYEASAEIAMPSLQ